MERDSGRAEVADSGLMSCGADLKKSYGRAASLVDRVFKGADEGCADMSSVCPADAHGARLIHRGNGASRRSGRRSARTQDFSGLRWVADKRWTDPFGD